MHTHTNINALSDARNKNIFQYFVCISFTVYKLRTISYLHVSLEVLKSSSPHSLIYLLVMISLGR